MPQDDIPEFDSKKVYLVSGKTLQEFKRTIRRERPDVVTDSYLSKTVTDDGTYLKILLPPGLSSIGGMIRTLNLNVCINNVATPVTFLVA